MHLKSISEKHARDIKSKAASLGMSPSEYFVYLHLKFIAKDIIENNKDNEKNKKNKKKK
jgi:hypothetical protein